MWWMLQRRHVNPSSPIPAPEDDALSPSISTSSMRMPLRPQPTSIWCWLPQLGPLRMRLRRTVTLLAWMEMHPLLRSPESIPVPGVVTMMSLLWARNTVPAGTPVFDGPGHEPDDTTVVEVVLGGMVDVVGGGLVVEVGLVVGVVDVVEPVPPAPPVPPVLEVDSF